ncbi:MAG TPA: fumarylacetoacetate hydrolase family protein [Stellaceae bacterium]|nr:fumarylacetoacetate hydrolase family protein [Stellaceae bacterium]
MASPAMTDLAERLFAAWRTNTPLAGVPAALVPGSDAEAYAAQSAVVERLIPRLGPIVGWKVGAPGPAAEPNAAPLLADLVQPAPARMGGKRLRVRGLEAELAFRFGRDLPPRSQPYSEAEVGAAIASVHPAIELVESRIEDWQGAAPLSRLADLQSNGGFCFGPAIADWRAVDYLKQPVSLLVDGKPVAEAVGGNAAGHPLRLLVWLAGHAGRLGRGLRAGDIVTTGSHTPLRFAPPKAGVVARFPGVGESSLDLSTP